MKPAASYLAVAVAVCVTCAGPVAATDLRIVASDWPPYVDASISRSGIATSLVATALRRAGYTVQLYLDNWPRALHATQIGEYDAIVGIWYTPEREESIAFSEAFLTNELRFLKRADDDIQVSRREDLAGLRVGVVADYAYAEQPYDTTGIEVVSSGTVGDSVRRLLDGKVDLVLGDSLVLRHAVDQLRAAKETELLPLVIESRGLYLGVSRQRPDHEAIIAAFDRSLAEMKADGSYNSALANYRVSF